MNYIKTVVVKNFKDTDFIIFTGDNIDNADPRELYWFLKKIKKIKIRTYVLIGNHDVFKSKGLDKKFYMKMVRHELGFYHSNKAHYVIKKGNIVFVVADSAKEIFPAPNGYFNKQELRWLDETLEKYKDKKVVIIQHFPLLDTNVSGHSLWKKEDYLEVLKKHDNVIAIVSGHYHKNYEKNIGGIYHILTPSCQNGRYKIIKIDKNDYSIYTSLIE